MSAFTVSRCVDVTLAASKATQTAQLNGCGGSAAKNSNKNRAQTRIIKIHLRNITQIRL